MRWIVWVVVVGVVAFEVYLLRDAFDSPSPSASVDAVVTTRGSEVEIVTKAPLEVARGSDSAGWPVDLVANAAGNLAPRIEHPSAEPNAIDPALDARIGAELALTEQALATARRLDRGPDRGAAGPARDAPPPPSRAAHAAAVVRSSAFELGCAAAGVTCRSSADCCPGLACAGGIAGFGTAGRCEGPR